jgi:hypothetical protein
VIPFHFFPLIIVVSLGCGSSIFAGLLHISKRNKIQPLVHHTNYSVISKCLHLLAETKVLSMCVYIVTLLSFAKSCLSVIVLITVFCLVNLTLPSPLIFSFLLL